MTALPCAATVGVYTTSMSHRARHASVEPDPRRFTPPPVKLDCRSARFLHRRAGHALESALEHLATAADYLDPKNPTHASDVAFNREMAEQVRALVRRFEEDDRRA